jgi:hypothetical protein
MTTVAHLVVAVVEQRVDLEVVKLVVVDVVIVVVVGLPQSTNARPIALVWPINVDLRLSGLLTLLVFVNGEQFVIGNREPAQIVPAAKRKLLVKFSTVAQ